MVVYDAGRVMNNFNEAMKKNEIGLLQENVEQLLKIFADGSFHQEYEALHDLFQTGAKRIEAWMSQLDLENDERAYKAFACSAFWSVKVISDKLYQKSLAEEKKEQIYEEAKALRKSKYFYPILELLEENGELSQKAIAQRLGISTNTLSNFLRRTKEYGLWDYVCYGKYHYYHLTNIGKAYLQVAQQKKLRESDKIAEILRYYTSCLADEMEKAVPSIDHIVHNVNEEFGKGQVVFGNEADKLAIRRAIKKACDNAGRREQVWMRMGVGYSRYRSLELMADDIEESYFLEAEIERLLGGKD